MKLSKGFVALLIASLLALAAGHERGVLPAPAGIDEAMVQRDVYAFSLFSTPVSAAYSGPYDSLTVEEVLGKGLYAAGTSPTHIAFHGTAGEGSVRCDWRGSAVTLGQREVSIRFWLGMDEDDALPTASQAQSQFMHYINGMQQRYRDTQTARFLPIARGGLSREYLFLTCYADYLVQEYVLGPSTVSPNTKLTVAYDRMVEARSYDLYARAQREGEFGDEVLLTVGEYHDSLDQLVVDAESFLAGVVGGHESVVFLAPMGAHNAIAVEAWQAVAQWDLQTDDDDVVHAVRYGAREGDPEYTQTLANLRSRITTAAANDAFADDRIENVSGLTQYYRDIGAYGDITPDDGSTATFTPAQPPPAMSCANDTAVTDPSIERGLVHDCEALLDAKDTLRGTGSLDWSASSAVTGWEGITTGGTLSRVTKVELGSENLSGSIPAGLGRLFELTHLDLSRNSLTGTIPHELGWLYNLESLKLSGNTLTGCIPVSLEDVATNDLSSLNLLYCQPPAPEGLRSTARESSISLSWRAVPNTTKYRLEYRQRGPDDWTLASDTLTASRYSLSRLRCDRTYQFRVSAYGSGTRYAAQWSDGAILMADTSECTRPTFNEDSYAFEIRARAGIGAEVGTVSATHPDGDTVAYDITRGNEAAKFTIDRSTGVITLAGALDDPAIASYNLRVQAIDSVNDVGTAPVEVTVIQPVRVPSIEILHLTSGMEEGQGAGFRVKAFDLNTTSSYTVRVTSAVSNLGFDATCTDRQEDATVPAGATSHFMPLTLHGCTAPGGTITAVLLQGGRTVGTATWDVRVEVPPSGPSIQIWGLASAMAENQSDQFEVVASHMTPNSSFSIVVRTGSTNLAFGSRCTHTIRDPVVGYGEPTHTSSFTLHACTAPGGILTAKLTRGASQVVDTATWQVQVLEPPTGVPQAPTGVNASLTGGTFTIAWDAVAGAKIYEMESRTSGAQGTWASLGTSIAHSLTHTPADGPACGTTYDFRVRARGDEVSYVADWGASSGVDSVTTVACNRDPEFDRDTYAFAVAEDGAVDDEVGTVTANDPDAGDTVSYSITAGNGDRKFAIAPSSGEIIVAAALDHESTGMYTLTVEASDRHKTMEGTDTASVVITVSDVAEDLPPVPTGVDASLANGTFTISWTAMTGVDEYEAEYRTGGAQGTWASAGTSSTASLDYTPAGTLPCSTAYDFQVRAHGDGVVYIADWGEYSDTDSVHTGSCPPLFNPDTYDFTVAEDAAVDDEVGRVTATDSDMDTLTYSITAGNRDGNFGIDDSTGAITVAGTLDHETTDSYRLTVQVDDGRGKTATATVDITVSDVLEDLPSVPTGVDATLTDGVFTISWTGMTGVTEYGVEYRTGGVQGTWASAGIGATTSLTYTPTDGASCGTTYDFRVRAYGDEVNYVADWGPYSETGSVTTEACNRPPEFDPETYTFTVAEDADVGDVVGTVTATDPDMNTVHYLITAGNGDRKFGISVGRGTLVVFGALDYEDTDSHTLTVEARDRLQYADSDIRTDTATVTINVTDVAEDLPPAPRGLNVSLLDGAFTITWSALDGVNNYEAQYRTGGAQGAWASAGTSASIGLTYTPDGVPPCGTTYDFRVRSYGDGTAYVADWGAASDAKSLTGTCRNPVFGADSYAFTISDGVATNTSVGRVLATDPDDEELFYSITEGNRDRKFAINGSTGGITVAATLSYATTASHILTVQASDGRGGSATVMVTVSLTVASCSNGTVVPSPVQNPNLVRDCSILLTARDTLAGDATLNWSVDLAMSSWQGLRLNRVPSLHLDLLVLTEMGLTGTIPASLAGLEDLKRMDLDRNELTGSIPAEFGGMPNLRDLFLFRNRLTGGIPTELGNLTNLRYLSLYDNRLTGGIPTELGNLDNLRELLLDDNRLTGSIPVELGNMDSLEYLYLRNNRLGGAIPSALEGLTNLSQLFLFGNDWTGCIPSGLRDVAENDMYLLLIGFCSTGSQ